MLFFGLQALLSLAVLLYSAEKFVDGAAGSARLLGVSPFLIGVLILGFGTSAPEIVVSVLSALKGNPGLALGNAYGSNIANIGLVLGVTAFVSPLILHSKTLKTEMIFLVVVTLLTWILLWDRELVFWKALTLMAFFAGFMIWTLRRSRQLHDVSSSPGDAYSNEASFNQDTFQQDVLQDMKDQPKITPIQATAFLLLGGVFMIVSSHFLVESAIGLAKLWGVSDLVIGLTLVALGTSLPELVASLVAIKKKEHALAFGNVVGSNLLNTLVVVGAAGLLEPFQADQEALSRDLPVMTVLTGLVVGLRWLPGARGNKISRYEGALYLIIYTTYMAALTFGAGD